MTVFQCGKAIVVQLSRLVCVVWFIPYLKRYYLIHVNNCHSCVFLYFEQSGNSGLLREFMGVNKGRASFVHPFQYITIDPHQFGTPRPVANREPQSTK